MAKHGKGKSGKGAKGGGTAGKRDRRAPSTDAGQVLQDAVALLTVPTPAAQDDGGASGTKDGGKGSAKQESAKKDAGKKDSKKASGKKDTAETDAGRKGSGKKGKKARKAEAQQAKRAAKAAKAERAAQQAPAPQPGPQAEQAAPRQADQVEVLKLALRDTEAKLVDAEHRSARLGDAAGHRFPARSEAEHDQVVVHVPNVAGGR